MTGCLTSNTDEVSETGGGIWSLVLQRIYARNYGNMTSQLRQQYEATTQDELLVLFYGDSPVLFIPVHTT